MFLRKQFARLHEWMEKPLVGIASAAVGLGTVLYVPDALIEGEVSNTALIQNVPAQGEAVSKIRSLMSEAVTGQEKLDAQEQALKGFDKAVLEGTTNYAGVSPELRKTMEEYTTGRAEQQSRLFELNRQFTHAPAVPESALVTLAEEFESKRARTYVPLYLNSDDMAYRDECFTGALAATATPETVTGMRACMSGAQERGDNGEFIAAFGLGMLGFMSYVFLLIGSLNVSQGLKEEEREKNRRKPAQASPAESKEEPAAPPEAPVKRLRLD